MERPEEHCFNQTIKVNIKSDKYAHCMYPWYDVMIYLYDFLPQTFNSILIIRKLLDKTQ